MAQPTEWVSRPWQPRRPTLHLQQALLADIPVLFMIFSLSILALYFLYALLILYVDAAVNEP
jgi:uncharacterized membrane protein (DUF485 family)